MNHWTPALVTKNTSLTTAPFVLRCRSVERDARVSVHCRCKRNCCSRSIRRGRNHRRPRTNIFETFDCLRKGIPFTSRDAAVVIRPARHYVRRLLQLTIQHLSGSERAGGGEPWSRHRKAKEMKRKLHFTPDFTADAG